MLCKGSQLRLLNKILIYLNISIGISKILQRLNLDINVSTKYVYVRKHTHPTRMKKPRKSCFANVMKIRVCECSVKYVTLPLEIKISGCASVEPWNQVVQMWWKSGCVSTVYNHIVDKDFRFCRCRIKKSTLKSKFTNVVKARLCECSVQWYLHKNFKLCRCKPLKSFSETLKKSGWMSHLPCWEN